MNSLNSIKERISSFLGEKGSLRKKFISDSIGSLGLKVIYSLLGFGTSVLLARALGPDGYGIYTFAFTVISLLSIPIKLGLPVLLVREIAKYQEKNNFGLMKGLLKRSNQIVFIVSLIIGLLSILVLWIYSDQIDEEKYYTISFALFLLPILTLGNLRGAALRGLNRIISGQLPEMIIRPGILVLLVLLYFTFWELSPAQAIILYIIAATFAFVIGTLLLFKNLPNSFSKVKPKFETKSWVKSLAPLALLGGVQAIKSETDIFMLGFLSSSDEVGFYKVAFQGSAVLAFISTAVQATLGPSIAKLFSSGEINRLQRIIKKATRVVVFLSLPAIPIIYIWGEKILEIVFGTSFVAAYPVLLVLVVGQVISFILGFSWLIMNMTGHERSTLRLMVLGIVINVTCNFLLIPNYGALGAALASIISTFVWKYFLYRKVYQKTTINCSVF